MGNARGVIIGGLERVWTGIASWLFQQMNMNMNICKLLRTGRGRGLDVFVNGVGVYEACLVIPPHVALVL